MIHLVAKVGFSAHDAATSLKMVEKGLGKEDFAAAVLLDFPIQIVFGYFVARWSRGERPLRPWILAYWPRFVFAFLAAILLWNFPAPPITTGFFAFLVLFRSIGEMARSVRSRNGATYQLDQVLLQHNTICLYWCISCQDLGPCDWWDIYHSSCPFVSESGLLLSSGSFSIRFRILAALGPGSLCFEVQQHAMIITTI